jgi:hypothetical protein
MSHSVWSPDGVSPEQLARPHAPRPDGTLQVVPEWALGASAGAGGIYSSLEDMARFIAFQLGAWPASNRPESPVLARASLRESHSFHSFERLRANAKADQKVSAHASGQGLGWAVYGDCRFELVAWHNGGTEGHRATVYFSPHHGVGIIVLTNKDGVDADSAARRFLDRLSDGGVLSLREPVPELTAPWRRQVDAALALGKTFDLPQYEALFAATFRSVVPTAFMQGYLQKNASSLGACTIASGIHSHHPRWVAAALECEKGSRVVEAQLSPDGKLAGFWIGDRTQHEERLRERVERRSSCE